MRRTAAYVFSPTPWHPVAKTAYPSTTPDANDWWKAARASFPAGMETLASSVGVPEAARPYLVEHPNSNKEHLNVYNYPESLPFYENEVGDRIPSPMAMAAYSLGTVFVDALRRAVRPCRIINATSDGYVLGGSGQGMVHAA